MSLPLTLIAGAFQESCCQGFRMDRAHVLGAGLLMSVTDNHQIPTTVRAVDLSGLGSQILKWCRTTNT